MGWMYLVIVIISAYIGYSIAKTVDMEKSVRLHWIAFLVMINISIIIHYEFEPAQWTWSYYALALFVPIVISLVSSLISYRFINR